MEHKGTVRIETRRLLLRRFTIDDAEAAFRNWESDTKVTEFLRWRAYTELDGVRETLQSWIDHYADPSFYQWAIVPKVLGEPIGTISVVGKNERTDTVHIGYCIGSTWWRQGYTAEAFAAIIPFLFCEVKAQRIESQHDPDNPASGAVMRKCGLTYEGTLRRADWNNRGIVDACMYALLAEDYFRNHSNPQSF
ncbi:MAG: GNAT family N-acetyltransferase [Clostridia bacterium]|nr:GNAT family N-acetyltransferase [Clostridia bacterium]